MATHFALMRMRRKLWNFRGVWRQFVGITLQKLAASPTARKNLQKDSQNGLTREGAGQ
jgi:hypothetical protein